MENRVIFIANNNSKKIESLELSYANIQKSLKILDSIWKEGKISHEYFSKNYNCLKNTIQAINHDIKFETSTAWNRK